MESEVVTVFFARSASVNNSKRPALFPQYFNWHQSLLSSVSLTQLCRVGFCHNNSIHPSVCPSDCAGRSCYCVNIIDPIIKLLVP